MKWFGFSLVLLGLSASCHGGALKINSRVVGGQATTIEEVPYLVSLMYHGTHYCGASLIQQNFALTGAHCFVVDDFNNFKEVYKVRAATSVRDEGGHLATLQDVRIHPQFESETYNFDVAVVKICDCLEWNQQMQQISLIDYDQYTPEGTMGLLSGFGRLYYQGPYPETVQKANLPVLNRARCSEIYEDINPITSTMFCAGSFEGGLDSCHGDSGGPFVVNGRLVGMVSWGVGCGFADYPGVYTNVSVLRPWIDSQLHF